MQRVADLDRGQDTPGDEEGPELASSQEWAVGAPADLPDEHHHRPLRGQHPRQRDHRERPAPLHAHAAEIPQVNFAKI